MVKGMHERNAFNGHRWEHRACRAGRGERGEDEEKKEEEGEKGKEEEKTKQRNERNVCLLFEGVSSNHVF